MVNAIAVRCRNCLHKRYSCRGLVTLHSSYNLSVELLLYHKKEPILFAVRKPFNLSLHLDLINFLISIIPK